VQNAQMCEAVEDAPHSASANREMCAFHFRPVDPVRQNHLGGLRLPEQKASTLTRHVQFSDEVVVRTYVKPECVVPEWVRESKDADSDTEEDEPAPAPVLQPVAKYANPDQLTEEPLDSERVAPKEGEALEDAAPESVVEPGIATPRCDPVAHFIENLSRQLACTNRTDADAYLRQLYLRIGTEYSDHRRLKTKPSALLDRVLGRDAIQLTGKVMAGVYSANFSIISCMPAVRPSGRSHDRKLRQYLGAKIIILCRTNELMVELEMADVVLGDKDALDVIFRMVWLAHRRMRAGASSHLLGHILVRALVLAHVSANRT